MGVVPTLVMWPRPHDKLSFPHPTETPYEIWLILYLCVCGITVGATCTISLCVWHHCWCDLYYIFMCVASLLVRLILYLCVCGIIVGATYTISLCVWHHCWCNLYYIFVCVATTCFGWDLLHLCWYGIILYLCVDDIIFGETCLVHVCVCVCACTCMYVHACMHVYVCLGFTLLSINGIVWI